MADLHKYTSKEVLNKVLLDSSGNSVSAFSHTTAEALNAALDATNSRLNVSLAGGTISGDVTITGDLTVNSGTSTLVFDESVVGDMSVKGADGGTLYLQTSDNAIAANDVLGQIHFQAPDDTGADSDLIGATIQALATATFSDVVNSTDLIFKTGDSEVAVERMRIDSTGTVTISHAIDPLLVLNKTGGDNAAIHFQHDGVAKGYFFVNADQTINLGTATKNPALIISPSGNVGIGENDPDSELEIFHATDPQIKFTINTHGDAGIMLGDADGLKLFGKGASNNLRLYSGASTLQVQIDANGITFNDVVDITDTTDATDATGDTGALRVEGGASIAKKLYVGTDLDVDGTTNLDAVDIDGEVNVGGNYILKEQGRQNHVANTFASPYYFMDSATTDNIVTASTSILPSGGADRSVSAWIYPSSTLTNTYNTIVKWGTQSGTYPQYAIVVHSSDSNKIRLLGYGNDVTQTGSEIVQLGKWNHVVLTYSGTTNNLYVNGVHDSSFAFPNGALQTTASSALYIGSFNGADYNFQGSIGSVQVWNRVLDASEVKELYSGKSVSYEYKGADNTHRITGNAFAQVGAVSGASATAFEFSSTGDGRAGWALTSNLEVGKTYKASFTATSATVDGEATAGNWQLRLYDSSGLNNTGSTNIVQFSHGAGATEATFINTGSSFSHIGFKSLTSSTNLKISDFDIREIGCVAEYDGTGVSSTYWYDKSGNDLHATVTGAEIANVPAGDENIVYEEGTFTPTWTGGYTGTITYNTAHTRGRYVRVGDQMTVWIDISVSSATSNSDQLTFELPANARAVHNNYIGTIYFQSNTGTLGGTYNIIRCTAPSADATIYVHQQTTSGNANVTGAMLGNGTVNIYMSYLLA